MVQVLGTGQSCIIRTIDVERYEMGNQIHNEVLKSLSAYPPETVAEIMEAARPGDLLLVRTPGAVYEIGRRLTRNVYDHIAVVVNGGLTLNIVQPRGKLIPLTRLVTREREPRLLRPRWASEGQSISFVRRMERYQNVTYNSIRTYRGIGQLLTKRIIGAHWTTPRLELDAQCWICTEAILLELQETMPEFKRILELPLDYNQLGFATTNDFLLITEMVPELLEVVSQRKLYT
jgi:hypothetical protein